MWEVRVGNWDGGRYYLLFNELKTVEFRSEVVKAKIFVPFKRELINYN